MTQPNPLAVGDELPASWLDQLLAWAGGAVVAYAPLLTGTTTNPSLGTGGTITGTGTRIGGLVFGSFYLTFGTAPAAGSGSYLITLPQAANASMPLGSVIGVARAFDASLSVYVTYTAELITTTQAVFRVGNNNNVNWGSASPAAPGVNDTMSGQLVYLGA